MSTSLRPPILTACLLALLVACDDSSDPADTDEVGDDTDEVGDDSGPLYLVASAFFTADQVETYLVTSDTFDESTEIDPTSGVKLLGEIVPIVHEGSVYVTDEADPASIKRYDLKGDQLEQTDELSFAGVGINGIASWFVYIVSDTKAYVFDQPGSRLVGWNPKTMSLTDTEIDLSELDRDGYQIRLALESYSPQRRGDQALIPLSWVGQDGEYRYATGLLVLDVERDELVSFAEDTRCGEAYMSLADPDGNLYYFPSAGSSSQHYFADDHEPTCILRVPAGETTFDPDYMLDLSRLGSGSAALGAMPDGDTGFYFSSADEALWEDRENNGEAVWRVWHYDFESEASEEVSGLPDWAGSLYYVDVSGELYLPYWTDAEDGSTTTLYRLEAGKEPHELFSFEASWAGFGRLR